MDDAGPRKSVFTASVCKMRMRDQGYRSMCQTGVGTLISHPPGN